MEKRDRITLVSSLAVPLILAAVVGFWVFSTDTEGDIRESNAKLDSIVVTHEQLYAYDERLEAKFDGIDERLDHIEQNQAVMQSDLADIKADIQELLRR